MHDHAPQVQSAWQMRVWWPHIVPHAPPVSMSPGAQGPPPLQRPSSAHMPLVQTCRCMPQRAQAIIRGGSPVVQSHVDDAVHAAQRPSVQRSTPVPHADVQLRSDVRPTLALLSSQSMPAAIPS